MSDEKLSEGTVFGATSRRDFLSGMAVVGAGVFLAGAAACGKTASAAEAPAAAPGGATPAMPEGAAAAANLGGGPDLNIAIIGAGTQGMNLLKDTVRIAGVRFKAVCDIWEYSQSFASNFLKAFKQPVNVYEDYHEMLAKEKLDGVIIATPDWMHAEHTIACLKAGVPVYCEKEMSNTLEGAQSMVRAARETGKLLQIGHQRRSNLRYLHAMRMLYEEKVCGRITHAYGQWDRAQRLDVGYPKGKELPADTLKKYGYASMEQFRNWRWYKKFAGGPICDLGSHQIDVFNWFLKSNPSAVLASGGLDYYKDQTGRDWYDNVMTIHEFNPPAGSVGAGGTVRTFYEILNTSSYGDFYELFQGDQGTLMISEDPSKGFMFKEPKVPAKEWEDMSEKVQKMGAEAMELKIGESLGGKNGAGAQAKEALLAEAAKPPHTLHLENFFNAVRGKVKLNCPAEVAYETTVTVMKVNDAMAAGKRLPFTPDEFKV